MGRDGGRGYADGLAVVADLYLAALPAALHVFHHECDAEARYAAAGTGRGQRHRVVAGRSGRELRQPEKSSPCVSRETLRLRLGWGNGNPGLGILR